MGFCGYSSLALWRCSNHLFVTIFRPRFVWLFSPGYMRLRGFVRRQLFSLQISWLRFWFFPRALTFPKFDSAFEGTVARPFSSSRTSKTSNLPRWWECPKTVPLHPLEFYLWHSYFKNLAPNPLFLLLWLYINLAVCLAGLIFSLFRCNPYLPLFVRGCVLYNWSMN